MQLAAPGSRDLGSLEFGNCHQENGCLDMFQECSIR